MNKKPFIVMVDDNFHFMDESAAYKDSEHTTYKGAVSKCKLIVDEYLSSAIEPGMTAKQLYASYTMFGEDPYIIGFSTEKFSSWDYARDRCQDLLPITEGSG